MQKSKGFKDHHFISFGDYLMRLAAFEVYFVDGQILYHLGMPAIFFYLGVFFKCWDVHGGLVVKNPPASAGDVGSVPGSGRSLGEGYSNPLQYSCGESPQTEEPGGLQQPTGQVDEDEWVQGVITCC